MDEVKKEQLMEKMIYSINDFKDEMVKSMNYIRGDIKVIKGEVNELRQDLKNYKEDKLYGTAENYRCSVLRGLRRGR